MKTIIVLAALCVVGELVHGLDNTLTWNGKVYKNTVNKDASGDTNINNNPKGRAARSLESEDENSEVQRLRRDNINNGQAFVDHSNNVGVGRQRRDNINNGQAFVTSSKNVGVGRQRRDNINNGQAFVANSKNVGVGRTRREATISDQSVVLNSKLGTQREARETYNINNGQAVVQNSGVVKVGRQRRSIREQRGITNIMANNPSPPISGIVNIAGRSERSLDFAVDPNSTVSRLNEVSFISSTGDKKKLRKACLVKLEQLGIDDSGVSEAKTDGVKISSGIVSVTGAKEVGIGRQRRATRDVAFRNRCNISGDDSDDNIYYMPAASAPLGAGSVKASGGRVHVSNVDYVSVGRAVRAVNINNGDIIPAGRL